MLRLILYIAIFFLAIYLLVWLKGKYNKLQANTKKQILTVGLLGLFRVIRYKWRTILGFILKLFRK